MRTTQATPPELLTTREVADLCRVDPATVTRWLHSGRLPGIKVGPRTFRFRRSDVEAFLSPTEPTEQASA